MFEDWILLQGYPDIYEGSSGNYVRLKFSVPWQYVNSGKPELNSYYPLQYRTGNIPATELENLRLKEIGKNNSPGGNYAELTLYYGEPDAGKNGNTQKEEGKTEYTLDSNVIEKPIAEHSNYRTIWDHHLAKKDGTSENKPAGWSTATENTITSKDWRWIKEYSELPEGWIIAENKTKKAETYLVPAPVIRERKYYKSQSSANNAAAQVGRRIRPSNTFGLNGEFLIIGANLYYQNGFWVAEREFQYGDSIDNELYN